ncbi:MAG: S1C family serine protease [Armatimonadota bacterium]
MYVEQRRPSLLTVVLVALVMGVAAGALAGYWAGARAARGQRTTSGSMTPPRPVSRLEVVTDKDAIVQAVKRVAPAVVKIETLRAPTMSDVFDQLFGGVQPQPVRGVGSGFLFDYDGRKLVMTNSHVVGDADKMQVKMSDGRVFPAELVGADPTADVAVVKLNTADTSVTAALFGDSDRLEVGEWVIAVGNPFDYEHTVTVGVVSAKGYRPVGPGKERKVIQTDAAINVGNSGGPLVDLGGNVVGVNYAIFSPTGTTAGIGFAIPINEARVLARVLIEGGPWVGLPANGLMVNSPGLKAHFGLPTDKGVVVFYITPGSPAARAGMQIGDIILSVDGKSVKDGQEVQEAILSHAIGDKIVFEVQRGTQRVRVTVVAGRMPRGASLEQ